MTSIFGALQIICFGSYSFVKKFWWNLEQILIILCRWKLVNWSQRLLYVQKGSLSYPPSKLQKHLLKICIIMWYSMEFSETIQSFTELYSHERIAKIINDWKIHQTLSAFVNELYQFSLLSQYSNSSSKF